MMMSIFIQYGGILLRWRNFYERLFHEMFQNYLKTNEPQDPNLLEKISLRLGIYALTSLFCFLLVLRVLSEKSVFIFISIS